MPVYSVASHAPLLENVAAHIQNVCADDPLLLTQTQCFLPTRRACRMLERAFVAGARTPSQILPKIICVSDFGTKDLGLAPFAPLSQDSILFQLITFLCEKNIAPNTTQAYHWAQSLLKLLDASRLGQIDLRSSLEQLLEAEHALHRQGALEGLMLLLEDWQGAPPLMKSADHVGALEGLIQRWQDTPPQAPVLTLGIHHGAPIYTAFLAACARLAQGIVLLSDFDSTIAPDTFKVLPSSHPQWIHGQLLGALGLTPQDVRPWTGLSAPGQGRPFIARAFDGTFADLKQPTPPNLDTFSMIPARDRFEEATFASLLIRETLEDPHKKVLMVTPDRQLVALVAQMLRKWQIIPDDGAGTPLTHLTPFVFCQLLLEAVCEDFAPTTLLALLKHPLYGGGGATRTLARTLELDVLRRPLAPQTLEEARKACQNHEDLTKLLEELASATKPFGALLRQKNVTLVTLLEAHRVLALRLSEKETLWEGEHAVQIETLWQETLKAAAHFPPLSMGSYPGIFALLFKEQTVRRQHGIHPRVAILSPQQAQLMKADRVILSGLSEGLWPLMRAPSPWLSPAMESALGLGDDSHALAEAGRLFHEFCQGEDVILTRSLRLDGAPQTPARVWQRLGALFGAFGVTLDEELHAKLQDWQSALYGQEAHTPCPRPAPRPPRNVRPKEVSVSSLSLLQQDPYAFYMRHILKLSPLDTIAPAPDARLFGTLLHACLEAFVKEKPFTQDTWNTICEAHLARVQPWGAIHLFWRQRMGALGPWLITHLHDALPDTRFVTEIRAKLPLFEDLTLVAKADRIDVSCATRTVHLIDYKTGALPTKAEQNEGLALQLPLEAHMIASGAFTDVPHDYDITTAYWHVRPPFSTVPLEDTREKSLAHTHALWIHFWQEEGAYRASALAHPQAFLPQEHMSRIQEWQHV